MKAKKVQIIPENNYKKIKIVGADYKYRPFYMDGRIIHIKKATKDDIKKIKIGAYNSMNRVSSRYVMKEKDGRKWMWDGIQADE
jgi:hypothetical protein